MTDLEDCSEEACADAWHRDCEERERKESKVFVLLVLICLPSWTAVDYVLEPTLMLRFIALRAVVITVAGLVAFRLWLRTPGLRELRLLKAALFAALATAVAWMGPSATAGFDIYMVAYSLVLFGSAAVVSWPTHQTALAYLGATSIAGIAFAVLPALHPIPVQLGAVAFYATASFICVVFIALRWRLARRAFVASFQLAQRNAELSKAVADLTDAQARLVASEKLSALGRLLAGLSHEINNPMNVISNNLMPLREYFEEVDGLLEEHRRQAGLLPDGGEELRAAAEEIDLDFIREDFGEALDAVAEATDRILSIHRNLRAYVRGTTPTGERGDLNDGLRATVNILRRGAPLGVTFHEDYGDLPRVSARFHELNQVHFNLLQNAIDAVGDEGVVTVSTRQVGQEVEFAVSDTGPGFDPEVIGHVFDPFFTTKEVGKGTGLGLSICQKIVADHGGTITADRAHQEGARIVVRLPSSGRPAMHWRSAPPRRRSSLPVSQPA